VVLGKDTKHGESSELKREG